MNIRQEIKMGLLALVIGTPIGVVGMQPILYHDTLKQLGQVELANNPNVAKQVAKELAKPCESVLGTIGGYGIQKAARDYLKE